MAADAGSFSTHDIIIMATDDSASVLTADSLDTFDSASSATTVWGPGTLSGKVILSLGEASLRGLGHVILRLRLAKISSSLLKISPDKQERMYDDLLELSRSILIIAHLLVLTDHHP